MCACREEAEVEVQDPKARAKANWLRAFNKVCMQLQEVSNPAAARCRVPAPAACWAGGTAPFLRPGIFQTCPLPDPMDVPHPEGSGDLGGPNSGGPATPFTPSGTPTRGREC